MKQNPSDNQSGKGKQRLWVVSELYFPEMTSTGYYLTKIAEGLSDQFDTKAICGQPNYSARGITAPKRERVNGVDIYRVFGTRLDKNVIPFRIINMLTLSIFVFLRCVSGFRRGDRVLVVTNPPLMPFLTAAACRLRGATHILLIHDCYPEILYAAGKLDEKSIFARFLEGMSSRLLKRADRLIVVGRDMEERLTEKLGELRSCFMIPNWAELESVSPSPREDNSLLAELGLVDKTVLLYAGNMGYPNDIETFIEAAADIRDSLPEIHFIFLGAGVKRAHLVEKVKALNLNNITVLDSRPRSEQQVFLNACDVGIVSLVEKMRGVSMPSRTYNILAAGKPILALCDPESEIAAVVSEENVGWSIEPGNPAGLIEILVEISESAELIKEFGRNARSAAVEKYSLETAVDRYREAVSA